MEIASNNQGEAPPWLEDYTIKRWEEELTWKVLKWQEFAQRIAWNGRLSLRMVSRWSSHGGEEDLYLHYTLSNRFGRDWGKKKQEAMEVEENPRLGWDFLFSRKLQEEEEREKAPPYIDNGYGPHNLKVQNGLKRRSTGFGRIRRRRKNWSSKFLLSKRYIFYEFRRHWN